MLTLATLLAPQAPLPAGGYNIDTAIALAPLLQLKAGIADVDEELTGELLQGPQAIAAGVKAEKAVEACGRVRKLLKEFVPRQQAQEAAGAAVRARLLDRGAAEAALVRTQEAEERLVAILEFDAADALKKDLLGNRIELMRPDAVRFYHRSLVAAQLELDAAAGCFGAEERALATRMAAAAAAGPDGAAARGRPPSPTEREAAVLRAIDALPGPGPMANRGDLQNQLDSRYQEELAREGLPNAMTVVR